MTLIHRELVSDWEISHRYTNEDALDAKFLFIVVFKHIFKFIC